MREKASQKDTENLEGSRYFRSECRKASEEVVRFIRTLGAYDFYDFWLPCMPDLPMPDG